MSIIPLQSIDWNLVEKFESNGHTGTSTWKEIVLPGIRVRLVEYSKAYMADHWCQKGHLVHCLEGDFTLELENVSGIKISKGTGFIVSDQQSSHRLRSSTGGILLIVDVDIFNA